ncbi:MAG: (2Fe-2S) ferredoxin domain-containing protein [Alphaproteobacteria bacterium]|nr:(2Fe-2S) ferredoxin domain-containing protein [Alphaproteobacteria bacterium]MBF0249403.1 (2Fe-2S) ferredoxin domain-containing protein [Alphaproteobacteria bacterium]
MPRPSKHVFVCTQHRPEGHPRGSCAQVNSPAVMEAFLAAFQEHDLWGVHKLAQTSCIGPCANGPSVLVYPESTMYVGVKPEDVREIVEKHLKGGEVVERLKAPADLW